MKMEMSKEKLNSFSTLTKLQYLKIIYHNLMAEKSFQVTNLEPCARTRYIFIDTTVTTLLTFWALLSFNGLYLADY